MLRFGIIDDYMVIDDTEAITFRRVGDSKEVDYPVAYALKYQTTVAEQAPSAGVYAAADCQWSIPVRLLPVQPRPSDEIIDEDGNTYVVLLADVATAKTRYRVTTRNLTLAYGLRDIVSVWQGKTSSHDLQRVQEFERKHIRIAARIQPMDRVIETVRGKRLTVDRVRIYLSRRFPDLTADDQIRHGDTTYTVVSINDIETLGELFSVEAVVSP